MKPEDVPLVNTTITCTGSRTLAPVSLVVVQGLGDKVHLAFRSSDNGELAYAAVRLSNDDAADLIMALQAALHFNLNNPEPRIPTIPDSPNWDLPTEYAPIPSYADWAETAVKIAERYGPKITFGLDVAAPGSDSTVTFLTHPDGTSEVIPPTE